MSKDFDRSAALWQARCLAATVSPDAFSAFVVVIDGPSGGPPIVLHNTTPRGADLLLRAGLERPKETRDS